MTDLERWESDGLICTRLTGADIPFLQSLMSRPEMSAHKPDPRPSPPEEIAALLASDLQHWQRHGFGRWTVFYQGERVGMCGLADKGEFEGLNTSYHLAPDVWGHGLASRLVVGLQGLAPHLAGWNRYYALVHPANPASIRVLEKAGFSFERELHYRGAPSRFFTWALPRPD